MNIPPQEHFLYKGGWSPTYDDSFVECLCALKKHTAWPNNPFPSWFLATAATEIKNHADVFFSEVELRERLEVLRLKYHTFKFVAHYKGASWVISTKSVVADDEVWAKIFKANKFVGAYYYKEEPIYCQLACLFGMNGVEVERAPEVVVLSGTTVKLPEHEAVNDGCHAPDDEVTSPLACPRLTVRRKLFDPDNAVEDRESSTDLGMLFITQSTDSQIRSKFESGRALPKPHCFADEQGGPSTRLSHGSSCGSNSPGGWCPHLRK